MATKIERAIPAPLDNMARIILLGILVIFSISSSNAQTTITPPSIGQETKGTPAIEETSTAIKQKSLNDNTSQTSDETVDSSIFGNAKVVESRRESGQLYLIELEHSSGSKQYIEETGSDTKIESTSNDIEETPNLPKWKLGSW